MQASNRPAVVTRDVSKTFYIDRHGSERGFFLSRRGTKVEALKPVSLVAFQGEAIGIIGKNGSGKSTLLNMIAGHEAPTTGEIWVSSPPSLLSVGAALQPHLSGEENVRLGLLAQGLPPEQVDEIKTKVAAWADLGDAVNRPLKTYSSGMTARLKFSIATAVRPEILLVDEALSTGDTTFNRKAKDRMNSFLDGASCVFIVSHSPSTIKDQCDRAIWINQGDPIAEGDAYHISAQYHRWSKAEAENDRVTAGKVLRRMKHDYQPPEIVLQSEV